MVGNVTETGRPLRYSDSMSNVRVRRWTVALGGLLLLAVALFPIGWQAWVDRHYAAAIYTVDDVPAARVALVLGARVYPDGRLSSMLRDRVDQAVALYQAGKVDKILVSGDNSSDEYNEPGAMMARAIAQGVPAADVQPDYGGRRTYDSCYRARAIFGVEDAIIVTQQFHLPRAIFLCESLGISATGVIADRQLYSRRAVTWSELREVPATFLALIDAIRRVPPPVLGEPIPLE